MTKKTKLELTWPGKDESPKLEPRILIEDAGKSYRAGGPSGVELQGTFGNVLVKGDNLLALKALEADYEGKVKCVYIDPPFNTGQAFQYYDDGIEHSLWLSLMKNRLVSLHRLLSNDGSIYIHLDLEEVHYVKTYMDELFGRKNFLGQVAYERSGVSGLGQGGGFLVNTHEFILCYAKDKSQYRAVDLRGGGDIEQKDMKRYNQILVDAGNREEVTRFSAPSTGEDVVIYKHSDFVIETISLRNFANRKDEIMRDYVDNLENIFRGTSIQSENEFQNRIIAECGDGLYSADYLVSRGKRAGENITAYFKSGQACVWLRDIAAVSDGKLVRQSKLSDFWAHGDIPKANLANEGGVDFRRGKKPEELLQRLIRIATEPGDLVLDSFAGSGTTGAVAQKMGRRWIMVEIGDHAETHIVPRLKRVIDGSDQSGISKAMEWQGGGGFRYYNLAPSLLSKDKWGNWVVAKEYDPNMLAAAMCKHLGFTYAPSEDEGEWWRHGQSSETDFIYVTTQSLTRDALKLLSDEVGEGRSLMICAPAFSGSFDDFDNLSCTKIPSAILNRCEWGRDDYSLNVSEAPADETVEAEDADA